MSILCGGALYFVFACFGLMSSFFPSTSRDSPLPNNKNQHIESGDGENICCLTMMSSRQRGRRTIPSSRFKFLWPWQSSRTSISVRIGSLGGNEAIAEANSVAQEIISCIKTVFAFATENYELEKYRKELILTTN